MARMRDQRQVASDALSVFRDFESLRNAARTLMRSGFDRAELCLLAAEPLAATELGVDRFGCAPVVQQGAVSGDDKAKEALGPLLMVEPDQAPPGEALVISQGALCSRMQAHAVISGGSSDLGTVLGYCLAGEDLAWAQSKLLQGHLLLGIHAPSDGSQSRAIDLLWSAGALEVRLIGRGLLRQGERANG